MKRTGKLSTEQSENRQFCPECNGQLAMQERSDAWWCPRCEQAFDALEVLKHNELEGRW